MAGKPDCPRIGVLALQGAVAPHQEKLAALGAVPVEVRTPQELEGLSGIILPGGESTTMIHLLKLNRLWEPLRAFASSHPTWGVCAGAILLAKDVTGPKQESLGLLDIEVARNAFGRQVDSFIDRLTPAAAWHGGAVEGVFIRAPRITRVGSATRTLFTWKDEPVMVEDRNLLAATFHPELSAGTALHEYFLAKCRLSKK